MASKLEHFSHLEPGEPPRATWATLNADAHAFEKGARTRSIGVNAVLDLVREAASAEDGQIFRIDGDGVANSYMGNAAASVAWTKRAGDFVIAAFDRVQARKSAFGRSETPAHKAAARYAIHVGEAPGSSARQRLAASAVEIATVTA